MLYKIAYVLVYSRRYGYVSYDPRLVRESRYFDRRKEVFFKVSAFGVTPGKSVLMNHHELVHEISFDWPKEVTRMRLVNVFFAFEGISSMWVKWFWVLQ